MALEFTTSYLADTRSLFRYYKKLADKAIAQVDDTGLYASADPEQNSIAILIKHMAGNMRSRWTDFLTSDGEKPDRHRDTEFEEPPKSREELLKLWEDGWARLFGALDPLEESQTGGTVYIRGEAHSVLQAVNRQLAHYSYHVGQIVLLARQYAREPWQSLTIPRGQSAAFLEQVRKGEQSQR